MERIPEPELMDDAAQALAYAQADFEEANALFLDLLERLLAGRAAPSCVLDIGCGPGALSLAVAERCPQAEVIAVDGAAQMLALARKRLRASPAGRRVRLLHDVIPSARLPAGSCDAVVSNSLLHHLPEPAVLWQTVRRVAVDGAAVLIMDLIRPPSAAAARVLVERYTADEPEVLRTDFYNSLLAAFRPEEVVDQITAAGLTELQVDVVSDRHLAVSGYLQPRD